MKEKPRLVMFQINEKHKRLWLRPSQRLCPDMHQ